ncbi:COMC family protein [Hydrobacter penzbergensis]|jgi:COMC family|uniref:COMC family protein n=1 Tax=Hydrobacter penzbergensis TaxID=1235997 RepID=A0A8X8IF67_9BACT|nr:ComC/BlpC family leader-containing pheromone/bacteriocin [Hydrobacter penzbergensis]MBN8719992.1 ComC/BlpC family leader-containing pheromone/bacteriocin [Sediminibacterium magnilacihabitans]PQV60815.1 COMC family protein [Sediminibacterium magnilacihabitans]SDW61827.1 COMC family protein [Hydrobacter penzbergensis]
MKQNQLNIHALEGFSELDRDELKTVNGGSFWGDLAYAAGATARCIWEFARTASEFQASLPPSLKK